MNELKKISIGDDFDLFKGKNMSGQCGCILELTEAGDFTLIVYMNDMTKEEIFLLQKAPIIVRQIKELDFVLFLIRFGKTEQIFEIAFNPLLYKDKRKENLLNSNMILMVGVESNSNKIKTLRHFNMSQKMYVSLLGQYHNGKQQINYNDKFTKWVNDLDRRYSVLQLWELGTYIGKMGEEYKGG